MINQKLIINGTDIIKLFMRDEVNEILITSDIEALLLTEEESSINTIEDFYWSEIVDFGMNYIIVLNHDFDADKVSYDKVYAVMVSYTDTYAETFINNNFTEVILNNY
tara:strand:- start:2422 stop:2745 length:324 start_codon:yes stop_codon:yes gene_type:complete